nr:MULTISPECIES: IS5/IS1182 family transposase [Streptomyces]
MSGHMCLLIDEQWARLVPCLPPQCGKAGCPFADHRRIIERIIYRYRTGILWRDLPREVFGPWQTAWKRRHRWTAPDSETYKRRDVVERSFSLLKQWRGLATRDGKLVIVHRFAAVLAAITAWLRS